MGEGQEQELYCGCAGARYAGKNIGTSSQLISCLKKKKYAPILGTIRTSGGWKKIMYDILKVILSWVHAAQTIKRKRLYEAI